MAEDQEKEEASFVEEVQTAEFELQKEEREDELVVATLLSAGGGSVQDARALVAAALLELEATDDESRKARIHHSLGLIIEHRLSDPRRALYHYLEALRLAPASLSAIRSARRLFWSRQNWTMVLTLIDAELGLVSSPVRGARLLLEKGWILEEWLVSSDKAQQAYLEALQKDPSNRQVLARLRQIVFGGLAKLLPVGAFLLDCSQPALDPGQFGAQPGGQLGQILAAPLGLFELEGS